MRFKSTKRKMEHGQSFVEMAISFVFLLVVILGVVDVARIFYIYIALQDSAEAAAIYLAQNPGCPIEDASTCANPNNATYRARNSSGAQINWATVGVTPDTSNSDMVTVEMTYNFKLITPIITDIVGSDTIVLSGKATHVRLD